MESVPKGAGFKALAEAHGVKEFIVATDKDGALIVTPQESNRTGIAQWREVTGAERRQRYVDDGLVQKKWGDPDYVQHVLSQS